MIKIDVPNQKNYALEHVVMDVNGTLAKSGELIVGVTPRLYRLMGTINLHMLTADTHGKQETINDILGFDAHIITGGTAEKASYVRDLGAEGVVAIGNGANDVAMCTTAALGIGVLGPEGMSTTLLSAVDVLTADITDALDLLIYPDRLRATLRT